MTLTPSLISSTVNAVGGRGGGEKSGLWTCRRPGLALALECGRISGKMLRSTRSLILLLVGPPVGLGILLLFTTWNGEPAILAIRVAGILIIVGLVASIRRGSREERPHFLRYYILVPQAYFTAVAWALMINVAFISTRELEIEHAVIARWPDFPLWSDRTWASNTSRLVTEWMAVAIRLLCFGPILFLSRLHATTRQASAWIWSCMAYAGFLIPVASIIAWNFPGDEVTGDGFWHPLIVIGWGTVIGAFYVGLGTAVSFVLGRNPYRWLGQVIGSTR